MVLLLYTLLLLLLVYLSFKISNGDYFNLTFLIVVGYFVSAICCLYNYSLWAVDLHLYTIALILLGLVSFSLGAYFGKRLRVRRTVTNSSISIYDAISKCDGRIKLVIVILINVIVTVLLYQDIVRIASMNMRSWGNIIYNFRRNLSSDELTVSYSFIVNLGLRLTKPLAYIYLLIFMSKVFEKNKKDSILVRLIYLVPVILYAVQVILRGVRIPLITLLVAGAFMFFFFMQTNHNWRGRINLKLVARAIIVLVVVCVAFYYAKFFIGKMQDSYGVLFYVTNYLGGSLQLFDMYLSDGRVSGGAETFAAMIDSLNNQFGWFENVTTIVQHEYRNASTGVYIGNIYTGFRNYYNDFGILGMIFLSGLLGMIFTYWYKTLAECKHWTTNKLFSLMFYSTLLYVIPFHFFTDYFYALIGIGWIVNAVMFYFICIVMFKLKIRLR